MLRLKLSHAIPVATIFALTASYACAEEFKARLSGFNEIGSIPTSVTVTTLGVAAPTTYTGAVLTDATGTLSLKLSKDHIDYTLTYTGPFTSDVQQAHIHFGKSRDSGGIVVWLCQTAAKPAPAQVVTITKFCPNTSPGPGVTVTVSDTITAANVLPLAGQNVTAKDFDAITDAITSHTAYANIHTATFPGGEIRGQVHPGNGDHNQDHNHQ
jgi:CHRD domain